ncbi:xylulokinase [Aestuariivivens sediminis]|uniref:xylulokinase n=1 Tax=Aestuariivivens sediminis TaxID=2913557 RepID=UPI001F577F87|nr:FGGY-family carbohydrate kinase [Aestuariivivens sediminis]
MYLVINLGLKSIRGIVFNEEGKQLYTTSRAVYSNLIDHRVEQDSWEWKEKLDAILTEISSIDYLNSKIEYITSTTSSSCILGIDSNGKPLTKVMMVSDKRAFLEAQEIEGIIKPHIKQSSISCPESSVIPKALWFKRNNPNVFDKVKYWIGAGEFLNYYFTGEVFTDSLNASKALFENGEYLNHIINEVGLDTNTLPKVKDIGYQLPILNKINRTFKFAARCKYVLTTYDAICAVLGSYDGDNKTACDVSGTVTSVRVLSENGLNSREGLILSQKLGNYNKFLIGASNNLGGGIIEWLKQAFYNEADKNVYYIMENNAHEISMGAHGIVFLPYMLGERAPFKNANAKGSFFGINRSSTIKEFTRAVFESTAYVSNDLLHLIMTNGLNIESMTVSGGLARFDLINQIKADVTNKRIKVIENFESTSVGALILLMVNLNKFSTIEEAASKVIKIRKIINPSEENHKIYNEFFTFYKKLNEQLLPIYNDHFILRKQIQSFSSETISNL